jgi:hypothetical protein
VTRRPVARRRLGSARSAPGRKNVLIFPRAAAWARSVAARSVAARSRCPAWGGGGRAAAVPVVGPAFGGPRGGGSVPVLGPGPRLGFAGGICGARGDGGVCSSFYEGPAVAGDPVARPRRPRARRRPAPWAGCARRGPRRRGAVGVSPRAPRADSKADRRPEKLLFGWRRGHRRLGGVHRR